MDRLNFLKNSVLGALVVPFSKGLLPEKEDKQGDAVSDKKCTHHHGGIKEVYFISPDDIDLWPHFAIKQKSK